MYLLKQRKKKKKKKNGCSHPQCPPLNPPLLWLSLPTIEEVVLRKVPASKK